MRDAERLTHAELLRPLIRRALADFAGVVEGLGESAVQETLATMATDPVEAFIWEAVDVRAWDRYEAGGPLEAERAELTVAPELVSLSTEQLVAVLRRFATAADLHLLQASDPWRVVLSVRGLPPAVADLMPMTDRPEDLVIRIVLGGGDGPAASVIAPALLRHMWQQATAAALRRWIEANRTRPFVDHPGFAQVVERPTLGLPGVYLVRAPVLPFSPLRPVETYTRRAGAAVFETMEEFEGCESYYQQPGASFFLDPPFFRNRPPCWHAPARLAGGIQEARVRVVGTPWEGCRAVSVFTLPTLLLSKRPELGASAYRGRYAIHYAADFKEARAYWRDLLGIDVKTMRSATSLHPRASAQFGRRA